MKQKSLKRFLPNSPQKLITPSLGNQVTFGGNPRVWYVIWFVHIRNQFLLDFLVVIAVFYFSVSFGAVDNGFLHKQ